MMRRLVWINGLPLLLGKNEEATEDNVNAARKRMGQPPLSDGSDGSLADEVNGVCTVMLRGAVVGSLEMKYREKLPQICTCKCEGDDEGIGHTPKAVRGCRWL